MSGYTILGLFCSFIVFLALPSVVKAVEVNLKMGFYLEFSSRDRSSHVVFSCVFDYMWIDLQTRRFFPLQSRTLSVPESFLFVSTLDGTMHAVKKQTGEIRWSLKEGDNIFPY